MSVKPRKAIDQMPEYHPPLAGRTALRLDFNENTFAPSPKVLERVRSLTAESFTIYPEREPVERKLAAHLGLQPNQVLLTNAVDEAIHLVTFTFLNEGDEAVVAVPSFFMYDVNVLAMGAKLNRIQADETLAFPYERFLAAITEKTKLVILCSPNNPTGTTITREQIRTIANAAPQAAVLVDEAYFHFFGETILDELASLPNVIVARTFSKAYGLANLRIGALLASAEMITHLRKAASPYNVNGVALAALEASLEDDIYIEWYAEQIKHGMRKMAAGLDELGIPHYPSHANFILMRIGPRHKQLVADARAHGVLLRDRSSDPGLQGCVRITIGPNDHVERGLAALKLAIHAMNWTPEEAGLSKGTSGDEHEYE
ncbi:histidinol-phosphate transaminase [Terriglobus tenax]|uniref:histidinol-phosphate transaminase n=1 Tax=Terriglobus tenax TaxID=1111115 RepID=UPI0021E0324E|nr:histidinol-phosphate transaminase [Terriglobus tenax]